MFGRRNRYRESNPFAWMAWLAFVAAALFLDGFILRCLWNWHVSPVFSIRTLNIFQAVGLTLVVGMFKSMPKQEPDEPFLDLLWRNCGPEVLCFAVGFVLHLLT